MGLVNPLTIVIGLFLWCFAATFVGFVWLLFKELGASRFHQGLVVSLVGGLVLAPYFVPVSMTTALPAPLGISATLALVEGDLGFFLDDWRFLLISFSLTALFIQVLAILLQDKAHSTSPMEQSGQNGT